MKTLEPTLECRPALRMGELDPHRRANTAAGMWAWIWQRISALAIIVFVSLHMVFTYRPAIQLLLLLAVAFHAALGLRVILLDFNLVDVKYQRQLIYGLVGLGLVVVGALWFSIY